VESCKKAGVYGILCFGMGMTLREGNREYYYSKLDEHFPGLKEKYIRIYGESYSISSPKNKLLMNTFDNLCDRFGIVHDNDEIFRYLSEMGSKVQKQTDLFDF